MNNIKDRKIYSINFLRRYLMPILFGSSLLTSCTSNQGNQNLEAFTQAVTNSESKPSVIELDELNDAEIGVKISFVAIISIEDGAANFANMKSPVSLKFDVQEPTQSGEYLFTGTFVLSSEGGKELHIENFTSIEYFE